MFDFHTELPSKVKEGTERLFQLIRSYPANLTSIPEEDWWCFHFLDSLVPILKFNVGFEKAVDVGSGNGFPGIVLALLKPESSVTLLDSSQKKVRFLKKAVRELRLRNVDVVWGRAEELGKGILRESFDLVLTRALGSIPVVVELAAGLLKVGGLGFHYRTEKGSTFSVEFLGSECWFEEYTIEECGINRTILFQRKTKPLMSSKYPRSVNKILRSPLL